LPDLQAEGLPPLLDSNRNEWLTALGLELKRLRLSPYQNVQAGPGVTLEISTPHWIDQNSSNALNWMKAVSLGKGRILHVGFGPILANQQEAWVRFLASMRGSAFEKSAWKGAGCATALGVLPWGASDALLEKWPRVAAQEGINWFWAIDGQSLANVWSSRGTAMRKQEILLLDQDDVPDPSANRHAAGALYRKALGRDPIFVGSKSSGSLVGTSSVYLSAVDLADPWEKSFKNWETACVLHTAAPIHLVQGKDLERLILASKRVRALGPQKAEQLSSIWSQMNEGATKLRANLDPNEPLVWRWE
jgi:hypothetical protein